MLEVEGLEVRYGERVAARDVSLRIERGEVVCLLGPSGAGKTSVLRAVAGLETPSAGRVRWDGGDVTAQPAHRRRFGFVFQDHALFPHRDVAGNVGFGLAMHGVRGAAAAARVREVLSLVGLEGYERRKVHTLSGGEMQRVAIARALAPAPDLLLLDEPLGSLDRLLRERLTRELRVLLRDLDVAALYVTHDQEDAFALATRIAVMREGRIVQEGRPLELWRRPADEFVARFLGFTNLVPATSAGGRVVLPWGEIALEVPATEPAPAGDVVLVVPPDAVSLSATGDIAGTVTATSYRGDHFVATVAVDGGASLEVPVRAGEAPEPGAPVRVAINPSLVSVVERG